MLYYEKIINNANFEWVLFIHGMGGSIKTWKYQLEDYSKKYNLLLIDLIGHGKSKIEKINKKEYLPYVCAKKIDEILLFENISKVHIVSMSLGTLVALEYYKNFISKVSSLVLSGCIINLNKKREILLNCVRTFKQIIPKEILYNTFALLIMPKKNHEKSRKIFIRESKKMNDMQFKYWIDSMAKSQEYLNSYIKKINEKNIPILFISGKEDYFFFCGIEKLCDKIKNFDFKVLKNCGHVCSIENPQEFNNISLKFFNKIKIEYS